jgi:hypothetical protein
MVRSLVDGEQPFGEHTVVWDGLDGAGREVSSGTYFYQLKSDGQILNRKMLLLR